MVLQARLEGLAISRRCCIDQAGARACCVVRLLVSYELLLQGCSSCETDTLQIEARKRLKYGAHRCGSRHFLQLRRQLGFVSWVEHL